MTISIVKVSAIPTKLPWVEGTDYTVVAGDPQQGDKVRIRSPGGESFQATYTPPPSSPPPTPPKSCLAFDFKSRFTAAERVAIRAAAANSGALYDFVDMLDSAIQSRLVISTEDDSTAAAGVDALIAAGVINANRRGALLA